MKTKKQKPVYSINLEDIPEQISDSEVLTYLQTKNIDWNYLNNIKKITDFNDEVISNWLNVSVKTYRSYRLPNNKFKDNVKEQIILLLSVVRHGINVFGTAKEFNQWLNSRNFFFDNKNPNAILNTVSGIRFVDDRLTSIEYGDNV
jgi:uncharacterized protein (DUF2384 family)